MKANIEEYGSRFGINLEAETMEEMAELVRFGINRTLKLEYTSTCIYKDGKCCCYLTIGKRKQSSNSIQPAK